MNQISSLLTVLHVPRAVGSGQAASHPILWQGLAYPDANVYTVVLMLVFENHSESKNRSFLKKIVPKETLARSPTL